MAKMKLRDIGEFPFLRRLRERVPKDSRVLLNIGDDCAALSLPGTTVLTTDALIENVHFRREWGSFFQLGEKAFATSASDIAAMGGEPTFALLSLGVPQDEEVEDLERFFDGFVRGAASYGAALVGGNMSAAPCFMISVTLLGHTPDGVIARRGACIGDDLYVSGTLGDATLGLRMLQEGRDDAEAQEAKARFLTPTARVTIGRTLAARKLATAMIDVSDGLLQDLGHLCEASRVGAEIDAPLLPLSSAYRAIVGESEWGLALSGGEDYELLFTAPSEARVDITEIATQQECPITRIGKIITQSEGLDVKGVGGVAYSFVREGFDHFR